MSDIFDEVDDILNEVDATLESKEVSEADADVSFNESELQDIMAEIDNLDGEQAQATPVVFDEVQHELENTEASHHVEETEVLAFEKAEPEFVPHNPPVKKPEVSFEARGQMNLNLSFKIGDEVAMLSVHPEFGLTLTLSGVELTLTEEEGCKVSMINGVKFTIPLTKEDSASKKKAA